MGTANEYLGNYVMTRQLTTSDAKMIVRECYQDTYVVEAHIQQRIPVFLFVGIQSLSLMKIVTMGLMTIRDASQVV